MVLTKPRRTLPPPALLLALAGVALAIAGSLGPWARVPTFAEVYGGGAEGSSSFRVSGPEVSGMIPLVGDGMFCLALGSAAGLLVIWRLARPESSGFALLTALVLLALVGLVGLVNWSNTASIPVSDPTIFFSGNVEPNWGVMLVTLAAWPGAVFILFQLWVDELR